MKNLSLKKLVSSSVIFGVVSVGAQIVDVTPESWNAQADEGTKTEEMKCGAGGCGAAGKEVKKKSLEKKCGAENKTGTEKKCGTEEKKK